MKYLVFLISLAAFAQVPRPGGGNASSGGSVSAGNGITKTGDVVAVDTAIVPTKNLAGTFAELQTFAKGINIASSTALATAGDIRYNSGVITYRDASGNQTLMINPFTTRGDLVIQGASGPARLAAGTAGSFLCGNGAASDPSYCIPNASQITNAFDKSTNNSIGSFYMDIGEIAAPSAPGANVARLYSKDDAGTTKVCYKDSAGAETCIGASGGSPGGSDTQIQYNNAGSFGGSANLTFNGTVQTLTNNAVGVTTTDAFVIQNTTAATAGNQQWSPRLRFRGSGWKTNATAAAQDMEWFTEARAFERAVAPDISYHIIPRRNGSTLSGVSFCYPDANITATILILDGGNRCDTSVGYVGVSVTASGSAISGNMYANASVGAQWGQTGLTVGNSSFFGWSSGSLNASATATRDTAVYRNAAGVVESNNGTAGILRDFTGRQYRNPPVAVASLVTCDAQNAGSEAAVNDANAPAWGVTVASGGSVFAKVVCNGTNWTVIGI